MDLWAGESAFDCRRSKKFYIFHSIQTDPGAQPVFYAMGTEGSIPGVKTAKE